MELFMVYTSNLHFFDCDKWDQMEIKFGSFEWIANYNEIRNYFAWTLNYHNAQRKGPSEQSINVLEIGCGTSGISERLKEDFPVLAITATDYDEECIRHLRRQYPRSNNQYEVLDILSERDFPQVRYCSFHTILDKGTYDALLVEGSVAQVIENIYKFLDIDGCYLLFSIHSVDFMNNFFSNPHSGLEILRSEAMFLSGKASNCSVTLLRKNVAQPFQFHPFVQYEKYMLDQHYKTENPLLTSHMEMQLRKAFSAVSDTSPGLPLLRAFEVMFDPALEYEYSLFLEDLDILDPPLRTIGFITLPEALRFLNEMQ